MSMGLPDLQPRFTRLSKVLAGVLAVLFVIAVALPSSRDYLCLVPGKTLPCVWNLLTAGFVTTNIVEVLVAVVSLLLLARVVEPVYGSTEFLKLILVVELAASAATFVLAYLIFLGAPASLKGKTLYTQFSGFHGVLGGLLVAIKQISPQQEVLLGGVLRLRAQHVPSVYVLAVGVLALLLRAWAALPFLLFGTYAAWAYLRFFQQAPEAALKGDPSPEFAFSSFFPAPLAPGIDAAAGVLGRLTGLRHDGSGGGLEGKSLLPTVGSALGGSSVDANRRRERGARALEERLEMQRVAEAPVIESAAAAAAASSLPEVPAATAAAAGEQQA